MKERVIVCGYPKSGNTWLVRLTAEILKCPVRGFWAYPDAIELGVEGFDRQSDFECFKAHQPIQQLEDSLKVYGNGTERIIYVYRDPRAVAVSAKHYFVIPKYRTLHTILSKFPNGNGLYRRLLHKPAHCSDQIIEGLTQGTSLGSWLEEPWQQHVAGYLDRPGVLCIGYEALKNEPLETAQKISNFLGVQRSNEALQAALYEQSFARKKQQLQRSGAKGKAQLLRKGSAEAWKNELTDQQIRQIETNSRKLMKRLGYQLSI